MKKPLKQALFWTPRILGILFAIFISVFALDVFGQGYSFAQVVLALGMHLIPTGILLVVLMLAWRWEWIGGILFPGLGIWYLVMAWGKFHWSVYLTISGPLILVGILFLINWRYRGALRSTS
jgi:hypothetical protein